MRLVSYRVRQKNELTPTIGASVSTKEDEKLSMRMNVLSVISNNILPFQMDKVLNTQYITIGRLSNTMTIDMMKRGVKSGHSKYRAKIYSLYDAVMYDIANDNSVRGGIDDDARNLVNGGTLQTTIAAPNGRSKSLITSVITGDDYGLLNSFRSLPEEIFNKDTMSTLYDMNVDTTDISLLPYKMDRYNSSKN